MELVVTPIVNRWRRRTEERKKDILAKYEFESRDGAVARTMWPRFDSDLCHTWLEFAVGSRLAQWVFLWVLLFSSLHKKTNISKFQLDQDSGPP